MAMNPSMAMLSKDTSRPEPISLSCKSRDLEHRLGLLGVVGSSIRIRMVDVGRPEHTES
jgi:hypothetical protein